MNTGKLLLPNCIPILTSRDRITLPLARLDNICVMWAYPDGDIM